MGLKMYVYVIGCSLAREHGCSAIRIVIVCQRVSVCLSFWFHGGSRNTYDPMYIECATSWYKMAQKKRSTNFPRTATHSIITSSFFSRLAYASSSYCIQLVHITPFFLAHIGITGAFVASRILYWLRAFDFYVGKNATCVCVWLVWAGVSLNIEQNSKW